MAESTFKVRRRHGSVYVAVLGTAVIISLIGLTSIHLSRLDLKSAIAQNDRAYARQLAQSGVELAMATIDSDPSWRSNYNHGDENVVSPSGVNEEIIFRFLDNTDSNLRNDTAQDVEIQGIPNQALAEQVAETKQSIDQISKLAKQERLRGEDLEYAVEIQQKLLVDLYKAIPSGWERGCVFYGEFRNDFSGVFSSDAIERTAKVCLANLVLRVFCVFDNAMVFRTGANELVLLIDSRDGEKDTKYQIKISLQTLGGSYQWRVKFTSCYFYLVDIGFQRRRVPPRVESSCGSMGCQSHRLHCYSPHIWCTGVHSRSFIYSRHALWALGNT